MQLFVKKGITVFTLVIVIAILLFALCVAAMRTLAPMGGKYADNIQHQVSQLIGRPVQIGHLMFTVKGITPTAHLSDLIIYSKDGSRPEMSFEGMDITLDMLTSAVKLDWIPKRVVLSGSRIRVDRTLEGRLVVSGFEFGGGDGENYSLDILNDLTFKVKDLDVLWNDVPLGLEYELHTDEMDVYLAGDNLSINGSVVLPKGFDSKVDLAIDVRGPANEYAKWAGVFVATTQDLNLLGLPLQLAEDLPVTLQSGEAKIEMTGSWTGRSALQVEVAVDAENISIESNESATVDQTTTINELGTNIQVVLGNKQWHIETDKVHLVTNDVVWPDSGFELQFQRDKDVLRDFKADIDFVDVATLARIMAAVMPDNSSVKLLNQHQPSGSVSNLKIRAAEIRPEYVGDLEGDGEFSNLSWQQFQQIPGLDKISGSVNFSDQVGEVIVTGTEVSYQSERMFDESLHFDDLLAQVSLDFSEQDLTTLTLQQLRVSNNEISVDGFGSLSIARDSPAIVDLQMSSPGIDLDFAGKYLPKTLNPVIRGWLKGGLLGGRAENAVFTLQGPLSKEAFKNRELKLDGTVQARGVRVHYLNEYPDIENVDGDVRFLDYGVRADLTSGTVSQSTIRSGYVKIDNFFQSVVELDVFSEGTAVGAVQYLKNAKFGQKLVPFLETVETAGPVSLGLQIEVPLGKMRETRERVIKGTIGLKRNLLAIPENNLEFTKVSGELRFNGANYSGENIKATFRGKPVIGAVTTEADREIHISVSGKMEAAELLPGNALLAAIAHGSAPWHGVFILPSREDARNGVKQKLVLRSGLHGTAFDLPIPVGKTSDEIRSIKIETDIAAGSRVAHISYGDDLRAVMELGGQQGNYTVLNADIACGDTVPNLQASGYSLHGDCDQLDLGMWISRVRELSPKKGDTGNFPVNINAQFDSVLNK